MREVLTPEGKSRLFKLISNRYQKHLHLDDRSWNEETRVFINGLRDDIVTEVEAQLSKLLKHRSRPELEGVIESLLTEFYSNPETVLPDGTLFSMKKTRDQLLLLYPDEEAIKREERERIRQEILGGKPKGVTNEKGDMIFPEGQDIPPGHFIYFVSRDGLEALKKGEKQK